MLRQCAWCLVNLDTNEPMSAKDLTASHGICDKCYEKTMREMRREFKSEVDAEGTMRIKHDSHTHDVYLCDDGTMDTVIKVDGQEMRYSEANRRKDGSVRESWLRDAAIEACNDGMLEDRE